MGALAVALTLLEALGFLLSAALYTGVVIFGLGVRSWRILIFVSIVTPLMLYTIFGVWLKVPLPAGILDAVGW